jgi:hypothetical protein
MLEAVAFVLNQNNIESVFLGAIDYQRDNPYFLLVLRNSDGSTTAAYIEREDIERAHAILSQHFVVGVWTKIQGLTSPQNILNKLN